MHILGPSRGYSFPATRIELNSREQGTGKTTIARLIANATKSVFREVP